MASTSDPLRLYLRNLAGWAWNRQGDAFAHGQGLCLHEETLTEMLLLRMARDAGKRSIKIRMFSKPEEKLNGADWEWSIKTRFCTHRLRVQAKRLYHRSASKPDYGSLDLKHTQHARLLSEAKKAKLTPAYVFYNHDHAAKSALFTSAKGGEFHGRSHWGCCIAHASSVGSNLVADLIKVMKPWHELVDPKTCGLALLVGSKPASAVPITRTTAGDGIPAEPAAPEPPDLDWGFFQKPADRLQGYLDERQLAGVAYMDFSRFEESRDGPG